MELKSTIKRNGKIYGMFIKDGSETYPIRIESLHTPMILDTLLEEGWQLYGLPFDLRKGSMTLEDLPSVTYEEAAITPEQEQDMVDMMGLTYKEVDLKAKMVKTKVNFIQWAKPVPMINTREELIAFLKATVNSEVDLDIPTAYLPLNSFVNPSALFTPEEYFDMANYDVREMIESRRKFSFKSFTKLVHSMIQAGLSENYDAKELVDKYFSWGICGIRFDAYERKTERSNTILGESLRFSFDENEMPYVRLRVLSYLNSSGKIHRTTNVEGSDWVPVMKDAQRETQRKHLMNMGYNYVSPVYLESIISEDVTTITGDTLRAEYNDQRLILTHNGNRMVTHTLKVSRLDNIYQYMPVRFWNIVAKDKRNKLWEELYMLAICKEFIKRTTVEVNASSYKSLQASGASPANLFWYLLNKDDYGSEILKNAGMEDQLKSKMRDAGSVSINVNEYLRGSINEPDTLVTAIETFTREVFDGVINIDRTLEGERGDMASSIENVYNAIYVAHVLLGVPLDTIYKQVRDVSKTAEFLDFVGEEKTVRLAINRKEGKLTGYKADLKAYKFEQANQAVEWYYVKHAIRELGPVKTSTKHIAIEALVFERNRQTSAIENYVSNIFHEEIINNVPYYDQAILIEGLMFFTASGIFEAGLNGVITIPRAITRGERKVLPVDASVQQAIQSHMKHVVDSTVAVADTAVHPKGTWQRYCVNAVVMAQYVVPNKGVTLSERPFVPFWANTVGMEPSPTPNWYNKGLVDSPDFKGWSPYYTEKQMCGHGFDTTKSHTSLTAYYAYAENFRKNFPTDKEFVTPPHFLYKAYPNIVEEEDIEVVYEDRKDGNTGVHKWKVGEAFKITRDDLFARDPELRSLFEVQPALPEGAEGVRKFEGYEAEDFFFLKSLDDLKVNPDFMDKKKVLAVLNKKNIVLGDSLPDITYNDVQDLDQEKFAVTQLRGRKYLIQDVRGVLWEVVV